MSRRFLLLVTAWLVWVFLGYLSDIGSAKERHHVGVVSFGGGQREVVIGMQEGMRELGYEEGKNIAYTIVEANSDERVRAAAEEFLRDKVDAVYSASTPITKQVARVIKDIPVVFNIVGDPVGAGLVRSMPSSGNNLTGCSNVAGQTGPKRLEVLKMMLPNVRTVLVLLDTKNPFSQDAIVILRDAAKTLGVTLVEKHVGSTEEVGAVMKAVRPGEYDAFFHLGEGKVSGAIDAVISVANNIKLPTMAHEESYAQKGMLAVYGPSWRLLGRQCAGILHQVLRGAKPADIPIQSPLKFDFIVNLKTAKALGIEIPNRVLMLADKLIKE